MSFDIGINFRATSGYVTDGANETYCLAETYPTTRGGATFGWSVAGPISRDRNNALDRRLAGGNASTDQTVYFRLDLPSSGDVAVHAAMGDATNPQQVTWDLKDNTTTFASTTGNMLAAEFRDATDTTRTAAAWPGSEVAVTRTFVSTQLRVQVAGGSGGPNRFMAHVRAVQAAAAAAPAIVGGGVGSGAFVIGA